MGSTRPRRTLGPATRRARGSRLPPPGAPVTCAGSGPAGPAAPRTAARTKARRSPADPIEPGEDRPPAYREPYEPTGGALRHGGRPGAGGPVAGRGLGDHDHLAGPAPPGQPAGRQGGRAGGTVCRRVFRENRHGRRSRSLCPYRTRVSLPVVV